MRNAMKYISILFFAFLAAGIQPTFSQQLSHQVISTFGGSSTTPTLYLSHTAGQDAGFTQVRNENLELRQGFEQALILSSENETKTVRMVVYPNPNSGMFYVATDLPRGTNYTLTVYDAQGKLLFTGQGEGDTESRFELPYGVTPGTYPAALHTESGLKADTKLIIL
jgi:hypothetical protein